MLKWIVERCEGTAEAVDSPIGRLPAAGALDLAGLNLSDEAIGQLLTADRAEWTEEASASAADLRKLGDRVPPAIWRERPGSIAVPSSAISEA